MIRSLTLALLLLGSTGIAADNVPDMDLSTASIAADADGANVFVVPDGTGQPLTEARAPGGALVDATITLTLLDPWGNPISGYPPEDLWLETSGDGLVACSGGTSADHQTDNTGQTTWSTSLAAGGNSHGELVRVYVASYPLNGPGLDLTFNSADINGDLVVNLSDIGAFTPMLSAYSVDGDFNHDGVVDLSDVARFTSVNGVSCP